MKCTIYSVGDSSVGMPPSNTTVESNFDLDDDDREIVREQLLRFFNEFHDNGNTELWFEDECPDCKSIMKNVDGVWICLTKDCYNNPETFHIHRG